MQTKCENGKIMSKVAFFYSLYVTKKFLKFFITFFLQNTILLKKKKFHTFIFNFLLDNFFLLINILKISFLLTQHWKNIT